jgi:hypothetical protein
MIGEILGKALIKIKGDTKHARDEIAKLSATEQAAAKARVKAQEDANAALERGQQRFGLYVAAAAAGWAVVSSSIQKYRKHLEELGPAGAAEMKKIDDASKALTGAQDKLQISIAKLALLAAPAAVELANMAAALGGIVDGIRRVVNAVPGGGFVAKHASKTLYAIPGYGMFKGGTAALDYYLGPEQAEGFSMPLDPTASEGQFSQRQSNEGTDEYNTDVVDAYRQKLMRDRQKKIDDARKAAEKWRADQLKLQEEYTDVWRSISADIEFTSGRSRGGQSADAMFGMPSDEDLLGLAGNAAKAGADGPEIGDYFADRAEEIRKSIEAATAVQGSVDQREGMLAKIFGPVSDFDLYTTAWQTLEGAVSAGLNAWLDGGKSAGAAAQEFLRAQAKALTGEALMQAGRHTAYGFGSLAIGGPLAGASAASHFKTAAIWAGVGVLAGGYAKATAPSAGTANANAAAGIGGGGRGAADRGPVSLTVVQGDHFAADSPRYVARRTQRNLENARLFDDYSVPPS